MITPPTSSIFYNSLQCVSTDGKTSPLNVVENSVPQSLILGPLQFILYMNDLFYYFYPRVCVSHAVNTSTLELNRNIGDLRMKSKNVMNKVFNRIADWWQQVWLTLRFNETDDVLVHWFVVILNFHHPFVSFLRVDGHKSVIQALF